MLTDPAGLLLLCQLLFKNSDAFLIRSELADYFDLPVDQNLRRIRNDTERYGIGASS
jgi:hypothetical protein